MNKLWSILCYYYLLSWQQLFPAYRWWTSASSSSFSRLILSTSNRSLALTSDTSTFSLRFSSSVVTKRSANSCRMTSARLRRSSASLSLVYKGISEISQLFQQSSSRKDRKPLKSVGRFLATFRHRWCFSDCPSFCLHSAAEHSDPWKASFTSVCSHKASQPSAA